MLFATLRPNIIISTVLQKNVGLRNVSVGGYT